MNVARASNVFRALSKVGHCDSDNAHTLSNEHVVAVMLTAASMYHFGSRMLRKSLQFNVQQVDKITFTIYHWDEACDDKFVANPNSSPSPWP